MDLSSLTWLTTEQAAKYLQLQKQTLVFRRYNSTGPRYHRVGGKIIRYKREDLDAWLESGAA